VGATIPGPEKQSVICAGGLPESGPVANGSSAFIELVLKEITDCTEKGEQLAIIVRSFMVRKKVSVSDITRRPVLVPISPRRVVFKPSAIPTADQRSCAPLLAAGKTTSETL
jgi:integration host factor subunit alpha